MAPGELVDPNYVGTVSYTHLDVYKRQLYVLMEHDHPKLKWQNFLCAVSVLYCFLKSLMAKASSAPLQFSIKTKLKMASTWFQKLLNTTLPIPRPTNALFKDSHFSKTLCITVICVVVD